ncbi:hypothetical protein [Flavobacterium cerinum]|uniref:Uncharacterized protein n=1 Tax=Flavobacterium cerinum TaxID=2502784 RepID=A0A444GMI4_9FLAO|nr:hypothetical protein [Flavobacterium cerinum]RWW92230.1 hypothetical protein EPI11_16540 [Flavobacterium cerinum]
MAINYEDLEDRFNCACDDAVKELSIRYDSDYRSQGPGKLNSFLEVIQWHFDNVETGFIEQNVLVRDDEAFRRIKTIARTFAKRCIDDYSKLR